MTPEQRQTLSTAYDAKADEWCRLMLRADVPPGWLSELHSRLSGPEFAGSGDDEVEVWRLAALLVVERRLDEVMPGYLASLVPDRPARQGPEVA